jgi:hypothetical protein
LNTKAALIVGTGKLRHFGSAYQISYELAATVPCPNPRLTPEDGVTSSPCSQHRGDVFPEKFNFKFMSRSSRLPVFQQDVEALNAAFVASPSAPALAVFDFRVVYSHGRDIAHASIREATHQSRIRVPVRFDGQPRRYRRLYVDKKL